MDVRYPVPPNGPALDDHATQVALRRYRSGPWLLVLAGVALLAEVAAGTLYEVSQPVETPLFNIINIATPVSLVLGLLLLIPGLIYSLKARRWRPGAGRACLESRPVPLHPARQLRRHKRRNDHQRARAADPRTFRS